MEKMLKVGLIVALEFALFAPRFLGGEKVDRGIKTVEEYWAETDLTGDELESLLDEKICHNDRVSYLACANSVMQVAEKMGFVVSTDGTVRELIKTDIPVRLTEKTALGPWGQQWDALKIKPQFPSFRGIWAELQKRNRNPKVLTTLIATGMNGYLSVAKDPHSYIIPLAYYEEIIAKSDTRQVGLGFVVRRARDHAIVRKVFDGSPASLAGLKKGDSILKMNGLEVGAMVPNIFTDTLKLKQGDRLGLLIERWDHEKRTERYLEIMRTDYVTPSVTSSVVEGPKKMGLLVLNKFAHDTCEQSRTHLISLMQQGVHGILLDLRDNPGGQVEEAACVLNMFVPKGKLLFETRYLDSTRPADKYFSERESVFSGPVAVLINSGSASASEIVAGALKDLGRATLVGEKTFGKGTFQDGRLWGSHNKIAVFETEGMYYFQSGWTPQVVGIEPDIQVEFTDVATHREAELYINPLLPKDIWTGPQSLTWLQLMQCQEDTAIWKDYGEHFGDDTQLLKAREWLSCNRQAGENLQ